MLTAGLVALHSPGICQCLLAGLPPNAQLPDDRRPNTNYGTHRQATPRTKKDPRAHAAQDPLTRAANRPGLHSLALAPLCSSPSGLLSPTLA
eukprot:423098-Prorocentrum_minimum.AAC.3